MNRERLKALAKRYWPDFVAAATWTGVPLTLLAAQAKRESGFDPAAISSAGAEGIMQLEPQYYPGVDPWDPAQAIPAAAKSMAAYHARFGTWSLALAAYNWGPGDLDRWQKDGGTGMVGWPAATQAYVTEVLADAGALT